MKKVLLCMAVLLSGGMALAQGIEFYKGSFADALKKAETEKKIIFMDAFAEWCGPCKRMAATVFTDAKVGQFFNANFICLKIDMEKGEGVSLSRKYNVEAYPTLLFINSKGDLVHKGVGALQADAFVGLGKQALNKSGGALGGPQAEKAYLAGQRSPDIILDYIKYLNTQDKPTAKIVNDFLAKADFGLPMTLKIIFEGTSQADSKAFEYLVKYKKEVEKLYSKGQMNQKWLQACTKTAKIATEFKNQELLKEAQKKLLQEWPSEAENFEIETNLAFYKATNNAALFVKTMERKVKKEGAEAATVLYTAGKTLMETFPYDKKALGVAEKYLKKAAINGGICEYYYWHAYCLWVNKKNKEAAEVARKALDLARKSAPNLLPACEDLLEKIGA